MPDSDVTLNAEYGEFIPSSDAFLSSIIIYNEKGDEIEQAEVNENEYTYTITVPYNAGTIKILAKPRDIYAVPELADGLRFLDDDIEIEEGRNNFNIKVTSSDGQVTRDYTLILRRAPDLSLEVFKISGTDALKVFKMTGTDKKECVNGELDKDAFAPQAVIVTEKNVQIEAVPANDKARAEGDVNTSFEASSRYQTKTFTVTATAQGETYSRSYAINVIYNDNGEAPANSYHTLKLMYNYTGAENNGLYRTIVVPVTGSDGAGDELTVKEGLDEGKMGIRRENYEFTGWYESKSGGAEFNTANPVKQSIELYAHWRAVDYTLTFDYNYPTPALDSDPASPDLVVITGNCETPFDTSKVPAPKHPHYEFDGWHTSKNVPATYTLPANITETRTLYAHWKGKEYSVEFDAGSGAHPEKQTVKVTYPGTVNSPVIPPIKTGYGFIKWLDGSGNEFKPYIPAENGVVFHASWEAGVATLALNPNYTDGNAVYKKTSQNGPLALTEADKPKRDGYTFAGWYDDPNGGTRYGGADGVYAFSSYTGTPAVLYARWAGAQHTLTLKLEPNGAADQTITSTYPADVVLPLPSRMGYDFAGWYEKSDFSGSRMDSGSTIRAYNGSPNILFAKWTVKNYRLVFDYNGGTGGPASMTLTYFDAGTLPTPSKDGYTFAGWYKNSNLTEKFGDGGSSVSGYDGSFSTLYAKWDINGYTVTFYKGYNNEVLSTEISVSHGAPVSLPAINITRQGYAAKGWYTASSGGSKLTGSQKITGNTNFYIQWIAYNDTDTAIPPDASGGEVKYVSTSAGFDEVHIFRRSDDLIVSTAPEANKVMMLVVAGGGGGGYSETERFGGSGGGGGGLLQPSNLTLKASTYTVKVGGGGSAGGSGSTHGGLGGDSKITGSGISGIEAKGGGGGARHMAGDGRKGNNGGSGGGGYSSSGGGGSGVSRQGNSGGSHGSFGNAGGGGYAGAGTAAVEGNCAQGGAGLSASSANVTKDLTGIIGISTFSAGGDGGYGLYRSPTNSGRGGDGGKAGPGNAGADGIVIVRFPYKYAGN